MVGCYVLIYDDLKDGNGSGRRQRRAMFKVIKIINHEKSLDV
jgi:hypothetical protein